MYSNTSNLWTCFPFDSKQYPSNGTKWQWWSLANSSICKNVKYYYLKVILYPNTMEHYNNAKEYWMTD
jgi:hypothetical protein